MHGYCVGHRGCPHGDDIVVGPITIAACNVGATAVGTNGAAGSASAGHFFQRGNNFGFPNNSSVTINATRVNTTGFGP
jgi:hypothetical protein